MEELEEARPVLDHAGDQAERFEGRELGRIRLVGEVDELHVGGDLRFPVPRDADR